MGPADLLAAGWVETVNATSHTGRKPAAEDHQQRATSSDKADDARPAQDEVQHPDGQLRPPRSDNAAKSRLVGPMRRQRIVLGENKNGVAESVTMRATIFMAAMPR